MNYIRQQRLSVGKVAMKTFLQSRFNGLFKPEIETEGLRLPGRWEPAGTLEMKQIHCDGGWLVFGWKMLDPSIRTAEAPTAP